MIKIEQKGLVITDDQGNRIEIATKIETAARDTVERFFDEWVITGFSKAKEVVSEEKPPKMRRKRKLPDPPERKAMVLKDVADEFTVKDIGDIFEKEGYDRADATKAAYGDIRALERNNKIEYIQGTDPKKYRILSRDVNGQ